MNVTVYFDGSCWPNPGGLAKYGYTLRGDRVIDGVPYPDAAHHGSAGEGQKVSNNQAEFFAMAEALEHCVRLSHIHQLNGVMVYGDSEVAIRLAQGRYRAREDKLYYPEYCRAGRALAALNAKDIDVGFEWVPRAQNQECDDLSKLPVQTATLQLVAEAEELLFSTTCGPSCGPQLGSVTPKEAR